MIPRMRWFGGSVVLLAALVAGEACKKRGESVADAPAPPADVAAAEGEVETVEFAAEAGAEVSQTTQTDDPAAGGGCPHAKEHGGPHEGCPHHGADGGEPGGCGCRHGGGPHEGCPHHAAGGGESGGLPIRTAGELAPERVGQEETCPVGGERFAVTAETPAIEHEGRVVLFGCMGCAAAFARNPGAPETPPCPHHAREGADGGG